ncbi:MAG: DUF3667 domain-containing protein [Gammaproteobacteria bacterium]|nr:MAG: DUF3667 domain-containing protein [Gammaproteobacteria bacterium]
MSARYCSACGQRLEPPVHSVWHFTKVAFEDLTHADSRLWRTLTALLFKPGYLTREFLAGRRARYLPPVRLYLVLSVVFFLGASATHGERQVVRIHSYEHGAPGESAEGRAERLCRNEYYNGPWKERFHQACVRSALDNGRSLEEAFLPSSRRSPPASCPRPRRRRCASTTARSWSSSMSMTSIRASSARSRPRRPSRRQGRAPTSRERAATWRAGC